MIKYYQRYVQIVVGPREGSTWGQGGGWDIFTEVTFELGLKRAGGRGISKSNTPGTQCCLSDKQGATLGGAGVSCLRAQN